MKTRLAAVVHCTILLWSAPAMAQILYTESGSSRGIDHFYGSGAPGGGVSFYDFNQDGQDDITLGGIAGQGISFYINEGGQFSLISPPVSVPYEVKQILWVDIDNDGDKDLYVACFDGHNLLFENQGGLIFQDITTARGLPKETHRGFGALWADFNRDGWLDLYYVKRRTEDETVFNENRLFLNQPHGPFIEVTDAAGVADRGKKPFCAVAFDYDNDKWPDIYINNDKQSINTLLRNAGNGTFEDVSVETGANIQMDAMGTAMGDYNNDGWMDLYLSNIPTGNVLLHNNGPDEEDLITFTDLASTSNTTFNGVAWGTNFLDADNDGDLDLYVSSMLSGSAQINSTLYENLNDGTFRNLEGQLDGDTCISFSNATGDANLDGIADIMVVNQGDFKSQLWTSQVSLIPNHYLKINLRGVMSNRDAIGTRIEVWCGGQYQMRYTHCGISFLGQNSGTEIIGMGQNTHIDSLRVTWPTGHIDRLANVAADQTLVMVEGSTTQGVIMVDPDITIISSENSPPGLRSYNTIHLYPNPATERLFADVSFKGEFKLIAPDGRTLRIGRQAVEGTLNIPVADIPPGMYFIMIQDGQMTYTGKWIKE